MGINQLLKVLKSITKERHISSYANKKVAIDTYCWLHKAIYTCAQELSEGKESDEYINYCLKRVDMLQQYNITVIMVFDGGKLPSKRGTEDEREKKRKENLQKAEQYKLSGDRDKAMQKLAESIDVTPQMAQRLLQALQNRKIECIVAPYEADAQLAYLSITNYVDIIITEDSDLLAYGANKILYKLDKYGKGEEITLNELDQCTEYNFQNWSHNQFLTLCILSGCDYLDSIPGVGIKTAYQTISITNNYRQAIDCFQRKQKFKVPLNYVESFEQAFLTFRFQRVYCPIRQKMVTLHEIDIQQLKNQGAECVLYPQMIQFLENVQDLNFLGEMHSDEIAQQISNGRICPQNLKPFDLGSKSSQSSGNLKIENIELIQDPNQYRSNNSKRFTQVFKFVKRNYQNQQSHQKVQMKQQSIDNYFKQKQEVFKPFKTPTLKINIIENKTAIEEEEQVQIQQDQIIQEFSNEELKKDSDQQSQYSFLQQNNNNINEEQYSNFNNEQFDKYSMSEEISINYDQLTQKRYYMEFGEFLYRDISFKQITHNNIF